MKTKNIILIALLVLLTGVVSCKKDHDIPTGKVFNGGSGGDNPNGGGISCPEGLYLGLVGFNSELYTMPLGLLNQNTKFEFENFIDGLAMQNGAILYHAVNTGLNSLAEAKIPENLINVSVVTFTVGLDQGSYIFSDYNSDSEYLSAVNSRINNELIGGINISAYTIGVPGSDVVDEESFLNNLKKLSSDPEHNAFGVNNMSEASEKIAQIAQQLYNQSTFYNVTLKLPAQEPNTRIRFTFDNVNEATTSECYIEGTCIRTNGKSQLTDIRYVGLECMSGVAVTASSEGIFDLFAFQNLTDMGGNQISTDYVKQWNWLESTSQWQHNSEFTPSGNTEVVNEYKSAMIMLVLDCSSSLGNDFVTLKTAVNQFVEILNGNGDGNGLIDSYSVSVSANPTNGGTVSGGGPYQQGQTCTLTATNNTGFTFDHWTRNGTTISGGATISFTVTSDATYVAYFISNTGGHAYVDLGLPSGLLWATCNVGADSPGEYGEYFAWGETQPKDTYNWNTYQYCNGGSRWLTKYCNSSSYGYNGFTDDLTTLLPEDDAATANWGDGWRMPTQAEFQELLDNTTVTLTGGGRLFTASNGNSLFLPTAGYHNGNSFGGEDSNGCYWSSSLSADAPSSALILFWLFGDPCNMRGDSRYCGQSVRPVRSASQN